MPLSKRETALRRALKPFADIAAKTDRARARRAAQMEREGYYGGVVILHNDQAVDVPIGKCRAALRALGKGRSS